MIRLRNSMSRRVEDFSPLDPENVRIYLCGPTVYDRAHLGNARNVILFDVLFRLLRHRYGPDHVTYVRNFTDVDDKINARAAQTGRPIAEITTETIAWYHADMDALGCLRPTFEPRATAYIGQMIEMAQTLIDKGHAYAAEGHVLFRVDSWRAGYGRLSGRTVEDMIAGARVEVAPYKENPMDFVLWKPSDADTPGWDSPWGYGRPGWHIECSAMSKALLGETFDIHGGGLDLQFPHHENEIAQSCCANGTERMAQIWLHNEMLQVEGRKMSKSLGNFFTVRDLLDQGVPGEVIRFVFLQTHYSKPMDWTAEKAEKAALTLMKWRKLTEDIQAADIYADSILDALYDDLNTPEAITELYRLEDHPRALLRNARLLGLLDSNMGLWYQQKKQAEVSNHYLKELLKIRAQAKEQKNFALADAIRDALKEKGITLTDLPDGRIQPKTSFEFIKNYADALPESERQEIFGEAYKNNSFDVSTLSSRYLGLIARELLVRFQ